MSTDSLSAGGVSERSPSGHPVSQDPAASEPSVAILAQQEATADRGLHGVSGPSFLGLDDGDGQDGLGYLYEEEQRPKGHFLSWFSVLLLVVLAVIAVYQRKQLSLWYAAIAKSWQLRPSPPASVTNPAQPSSATVPDSNQSTMIAAQAPTNPANTAAPSDAATINSAPGAENSLPPQQRPPTASIGDQTGMGTPAPAAPIASGTERSVPQITSNLDRNRAAERQDATKSPGPAVSSARVSEGPVARAGSRSAPNQSDQLLSRGQAYLYGNGAPRSCAQALVDLRKAADMGNARASSQLGALYATGHCVPLDRVRAYNWFTQALGASHGRAVWVERSRRMLWNQMTAQEQARASAK